LPLLEIWRKGSDNESRVITVLISSAPVGEIGTDHILTEHGNIVVKI
jgi:hypothetical protein